MAAGYSLIDQILLALAAAPMILGILWGFVDHAILPRFVPRSEIDELTAELMAQNPHDPEHAAFLAEEAAWTRMDSVTQGKWRRVRKELAKRRTARALADISL